VIWESKQYGINIRVCQDLAEIVVRLHALIPGLAKSLGVYVITPLPRMGTPLAPHIAHCTHLHILTCHIPPWHIGPGTADQMTGALASQTNKSHVDAFARGRVSRATQN